MSDVLKRCACGDAKWNKCADAWYMSPFRFGGELYRDNVTEWAQTVLNEAITTRTRADAVVEIMRTRIRAGEFVKARAFRAQPAKLDPTLTLAGLVAVFEPVLAALTRAEGEPPVKGDGKCSPETATAHRARLAALCAFEGNGARSVAAFDAAALVRFKGSLGKCSASSWGKYRGVFARLFDKARRLGLITRSPLDLVRGDAEHLALQRGNDKARTRRLMPGEYERLHAAARRGRVHHDAQQLADLIEAAVQCGGREGELGAVQWRDVLDLSAPYVGGRYAIGKKLRITAVAVGAAKTGEAREVPISKALRAQLVRRQVNPLTGQQYALDDYVWGSVIGERERFPRRTWENAVIRSTGAEPERIKAGKGKQSLVPASRAVFAAVGLHFHDLRREFASRIWESGLFQITEVRDILGHASVEQTETYLGIQHGSTRTLDAMAAFDAQQEREAREAIAVAVGSTDHNAITAGHEPDQPARGVRLVKGRKSLPPK